MRRLVSSLWQSTWLSNGRAYEVLGDDRRRWEYDRFEYPIITGEMPEKYEQATMMANGHSFVWESSFDSARRAQGRHGADGFGRGGFDPFELFNSMFARDFHEMEANNLAQNWGGTHFGLPHMARATSFAAPPHAMHAMAQGTAVGGMPGAGPSSLLAGMPSMHTTMPGHGSTFSSGSSSYTFSGPQGTTESQRTTIVNGRRETVITKRDAQGNETVRRITPEGETVHINGQLQTMLEAPGSASAELPTTEASAASAASAAPDTPAPAPTETVTPSAEPATAAAAAANTPPTSSRKKRWKFF